MEKLINEIEKVRVALSEISVYNLDSYTMAELYYNIAKKINEIIKELYRYEGIITEDIIEQNKKLEHLLNEGVNEEVISKINEMVSDGTFDSIINHSVFEGLNNKIENLESIYNNVKLFGAIGDGVADDTQAIQNAINSTVEGGVVYFPYGEYNITRELVIDTAKITLLGENLHDNRTSKLKAITNNINILKIQRYGCAIDSICFEGNTSSNYNDGNITGISYDLVQYAGNDSMIVNCCFTSLDICVKIKDRNVIIENCLFVMSRKGVEIVPTENSDDMGGAIRGIRIHNNIFHAVGNGNSSKENIDVACVDIQIIKNSQDITITNNKLEGWTSVFIKGYVNGCDISNNVASNVNGGYKFMDIKTSDISQRNFKINNNVFISDFNREDVTIANHNFIYCEGNLMYGEIKNNTVNFTGKECLLVNGNVETVVIEGNTFKGNQFKCGNLIRIKGNISKSRITNNLLEPRFATGMNGAIKIDDESRNNETYIENNNTISTFPLDGFDVGQKIVKMTQKITTEPAVFTKLCEMSYKTPSKMYCQLGFAAFVLNTISSSNCDTTLYIEVNGQRIELSLSETLRGGEFRYFTNSDIVELNSGLNTISLYARTSVAAYIDFGYWVNSEKIGSSYIKLLPLDTNKRI